ncbi:MAG: class I SAM-dependent methyltransferase [Deltaproteobacteria bacterium]|nr:class I SAM-dependent methyltransferase [Deltaproteobacteria bacterium]
MQKLNLGCGQFKKDGYINLDISPFSKADILHNLEKLPYPFDNNTFDVIEANHILEHLSDPFRVMAELYRILKPGGNIYIRVPHFSRALSHPQHKAGFDVAFYLYFDKDFIGGYTGTQFITKKMELHWFAQKYLMKKIFSPWIYYSLSIIGSIIDFFANLSPLFCSRIWCFWVGGFQEIEFVFEKPLNE